jgi:Domain of unknown function (DUF1848)
MANVISASRRTDIPAFYSAWFVQRLKEGLVAVQQPYTGRISRVSLKRDDVSAIVFWSKNYAPLIEKLESVELTTKNLFFHFTITAAQELEPNVPDYRNAVRDYVYLVKRYSFRQVVWRFDPLCITDKLSFEVYRERFLRCAELLKGYVAACIISFAHPYKTVIANFKKDTDHQLVELSIDQKRDCARSLAEIAGRYGIGLSACCSDYLVRNEIKKAACIDGVFLSSLFNVPIDTRRVSTRQECACTKSIDIGAYDTCAHGCLYCYANTSKDKAKRALRLHNPSWNSLRMHVPEDGINKAQQELFNEERDKAGDSVCS